MKASLLEQLVLKQQAKLTRLLVCSMAAVTLTQFLKKKHSQTTTLAQLPLQTLKHSFVIDAPDVVYEIQGNAAFPVADLFGNFDIVKGTGDTASGGSRDEIGVSTGATTNTLPLKAIDISQDPENSDVGSSNTNVMVVINNHLLSPGTAGLA